jgi:uncharacterized protein DUF4872/butirosin biosynthesis protein H-like
MTTHKHLKARVRARMSRTGERYAVARTHVVDAGQPSVASAAREPDLAGANPGATALRLAAGHAGVPTPGGEPLSEALALVVGGGIGAGVFAFRYEKDDVSTLFLAGRHRWEDDLAFLRGGTERLGLTATVTETGSVAGAARNLRAALEAGPVVAWVDLATLGTRGFPSEWEGGGYHVLTVLEVDEAAGTANLADLAPERIIVELPVLARARARIAKHKNRLLSVSPGGTPDLETVIRAGLRAGVDALTDPPRRNFGLDTFRDLAERIRGRGGKDSWARVFPRGRHLWDALAAIDRFVEGHGSGGGLVRPLFAAGLAEASRMISDPRLAEASAAYGELGGRWRAFAAAALPEQIPLLRETRDLRVRQETLYRERGTDALPELRATWARLAEIGGQVGSDFPLSESETADLLTDLGDHLEAIHAAEVAALEGLRATIA